MRFSIVRAGLLAALLALFLCSTPTHTQVPFDVAALMKDVNQGITTMVQEMLQDKRVLEQQDQGLIVAPLQANIPDADEDDKMLVFITTWIQEKMLTAMIQQDQDAHFAVIDRVMLEKTVRDMKLDAVGLRDPGNWPAIGKAVNAQYMLTGSYSVVPLSEKPLQLALSVTVRIVNLENARAIAASSFELMFKQPEPPIGIDK